MTGQVITNTTSGQISRESTNLSMTFQVMSKVESLLLSIGDEFLAPMILFKGYCSQRSKDQERTVAYQGKYDAE